MNLFDEDFIVYLCTTLIGITVFFYFERFYKWFIGLNIFFYRMAPWLFDPDYDENARIEMCNNFLNSWHTRLMVLLFKIVGILFTIVGLLAIFAKIFFAIDTSAIK